MKNKENLLYGIIVTLLGVIIGYLGTNYLNHANSPSNAPDAAAPAASANLPADHPPTGGESENSAAGDSPTGQGDVMAVIQQARSDPNNFEAQIKAATLYSQINRHEEALNFYNQAYRIKPDDYQLLVKLGNANFDLERLEEAERWYQSALKINPKDATVRMDLGLTYYLRRPRDLDRAIAEFRRALSYDSRHEKTLQNLTAALIDKGDKAAALVSLKQLEAVNSGNPALAQFRSRLQQ